MAARTNRLSTRVLVGLLALACAPACSSPAATVDAGLTSDGALTDEAPACPSLACGGQCCASYGRVCAASATCSCPDASMLPAEFTTGITVIDPNQVPGALSAAIIFTDTTGATHTFVVGYRADTAVGTDLPLAPLGTGVTPFAALGWRVSFATQSSRTGYYATTGSVRFTRACLDGVAGTLSGLTFTEQTATSDQTPLPGGCSFTIPTQVAFDIGGPCP